MRSIACTAWLVAVAALSSCQDSGESPAGSSDSPPSAPLTLRTDSVGLVPVQTSRGKQLKLEDRFQHAAIARRNSDGSITTECHDSEEAATAFARGATTAVATPEVR